MGMFVRDTRKGINRGDVFAVIGIVLAAIGIALSIIPVSSDPSFRYNAVVYVFGAYIFFLAVFLTWREIVFSRKARYAEATRNIHACIHSIRDAYASVDSKDEDKTIDSIGKTLRSLSEAFSLITGAHCRACIKTIVAKTSHNNKTEFFTETLARSNNSHINRNEEPAAISENTDFDILFTTDERYYLCNDLTKEPLYRNSNWPKINTERSEFIRKREYKYITTVVWPIRSEPTGDNKIPQIIGFLCIDSRTRNIFDSRYDIDQGAIVADALYYLLFKYRNELSFHITQP